METARKAAQEQVSKLMQDSGRQVLLLASRFQMARPEYTSLRSFRPRSPQPQPALRQPRQGHLWLRQWRKCLVASGTCHVSCVHVLLTKFARPLWQ